MDSGTDGQRDRNTHLAKELLGLAGCLVKALEVKKKLSQSVELKPVDTVKNPFA